ncbi:MAG: PHP domain-containing protein [Dehalococcoidia bacterium]|nr:PHP domain-containing protein [Dehalococcoidia bacterium]
MSGGSHTRASGEREHPEERPFETRPGGSRSLWFRLCPRRTPEGSGLHSGGTAASLSRTARPCVLVCAMLIDLHCHTWPLSDDSMLSPDDLIEHARELGLDGLCLTEHDFGWNIDEVRRLERRHNFVLLPGMEVNTEDGHILAYGVNKYIYGMHKSQELARMVRSAGGALIAAHPYRRQMPWHVYDQNHWEEALDRAGRNKAYEFVAGLEIINGRGTPQENSFSNELARRMGMRGSAGTDSHARRDIGACATEFSRNITTIGEFIEELHGWRFAGVPLREGLVRDPEESAADAGPDPLLTS